MTLNLKGVHYNISDRTKEFIEDKLSHMDPFKDMIVNLDVTITKEKTEYRVESNVHFKWHKTIHLHENAMELYPAIENLIHKMDAAISKEKEKVKDHHHRDKEPIAEEA